MQGSNLPLCRWTR